MQQEFTSKLRFTPLTCISIILMIFSVMLMLLVGIQQLAHSYFDAKSRETLLVITIIQDAGIFIIPALLSIYIIARNPASMLKLDNSPKTRSLVGVLLFFAVGMPAMNQLVYWNENMIIPDWASSLGDAMRQMEDQAQQISDTMLTTDTVGGLLVNILVVAVLAAVSEELFFRGMLQGTLQNNGMKKHMAVWSAAFIFSLLHFQFFGFVPRMVLGAFFGYLFCWTGSLYVPIFAHFLNNGTVVLLQWLTERGIMTEDCLTFGAGEGFRFLPCISAILLILAFVYLRKPLFITNNK